MAENCYQSGEVPEMGDVVECLSRNPLPPLKGGKRYRVRAFDSEQLTFGELWYPLEWFWLIRRSGETQERKDNSHAID